MVRKGLDISYTSTRHCHTLIEQGKYLNGLWVLEHQARFQELERFRRELLSHCSDFISVPGMFSSVSITNRRGGRGRSHLSQRMWGYQAISFPLCLRNTPMLAPPFQTSGCANTNWIRASKSTVCEDNCDFSLFLLLCPDILRTEMFSHCSTPLFKPFENLHKRVPDHFYDFVVVVVESHFHVKPYEFRQVSVCIRVFCSKHCKKKHETWVKYAKSYSTPMVVS